MTLYLFLFAAVAVHIALQYFFIPRMDLKKPGGPKSVKKSAALAVLKYLSTTALLASATYALIILVVLALSLTKPVTSHELGAAVADIQRLQSKYKIFREFWTLWLFLMALLAFVAYRREKRSAARSAAASGAGEPLPQLPPNEEMEELMRRIDECSRRINILEQSWVRTDEELAVRKRDISREVERLNALLREADVRRRASAETPAEEDAASGSYPRLRRLFASKGFLKTLEGTTRSLGYLGTVLLVLCVVGVNVPVLHGALADRALRLSELQVEASKDEARRSFDRVTAEEGVGTPAPLTDEDRRMVREAARLFEQAFTSSNDLRKRKDEDDDDNKSRAVFYTRSFLVRDQIVGDFRRNPPGGPDSHGPYDPPDDAGPSPRGPRGPNNEGPSGTGGARGQRGRRNDVGVEPHRGGGDDGGSHGGAGAGGGGTGGGGPQERPLPPSPSAGGGVDDLRARAVSDDHGPRTMLGERAAEAFENELARRPSLRAKLRAKLAAYKASFSEPFEPLDLGKFAFGEAVGYAVDNSWQPPNEVARQVTKVGQTAIKDAAKNIFARAVRGGKATYERTVGRMYQTLVCRYFSDVAGDAGFADAVEHVQEGLPELPVLTEEEAAALREVALGLPREDSLFVKVSGSYTQSPPALPLNEAERAENEAEAARLRKTVGGRGGRGLSEEERGLVDSYEDHYPGRAGSEAETPKGRLLAAAGEDVTATKSQNLLSQSRDFSSLKQSVDVGGILMGRAPEPDSKGGDFRDLRWEEDGGALTIFLRRADGSETAVGPFEKSLVHQALGYVADGRKVVVTIILAGPVRRKVMLHPALADTQLGRDIVEFDKLVFRFVDDCEPGRKQSDDLTVAQLTLYDIADGLRRLGVLREAGRRGLLTTKLRKTLSEDAAWESRVFGNAKLYGSLRPALLEAEGLERPENSILAWGKAYFDQTLVRDVKRCAAQHGDHLAAVHVCLSDAFGENAHYASVDTMNAWLGRAGAPDLSWRSIAEELPYRTDPDLSFLGHAGGDDPAEQLWPFQFRYEIAFPVEAPFRNVSDTSDAYRTPWEFSGLRGLIAEKVWRGVESDAGLRTLYKRVRDFTVLQRLFRTSLDGGLGLRFPVEKLVTLTRETSGSLSSINTPRWDDERLRKCD
jgi:hypothetical protein